MEKAGTKGFMAPEVCLRQPYGFKADIYSLGVVLYLLITMDCEPFENSSAHGAENQNF